jgi:tetratricopeptide (TPR) repeat protein
VLAASLVLLALAAGVVGATWGMLRATRAEARARSEAKLKAQALQDKQAALDEAENILSVARQSLDEYTRFANQLSDQPQLQPLQRELLLKALKFYEELARQKQSDPSILLRRANAYRNIGSIQYTLDQNDEAAAAMRQAIELYRPLVVHFASSAVDLCGVYTGLQQLLVQTRQFAEARRVLDESVDFFEKLAAEHPDQPLYKEQLPKLRVQWARFMAASAAPADGENALREVMAQGAEDHRLWFDLGYLQLARDDVDGYRRTCAEVLDRFEATDNLHEANTIAWLCVLAPDAVSQPQRVVALAEKAVARSHTVTAVHRQAMLNTLGAALYRAGRFDAAVARLHEAASAHSKKGTAADWLFLAMAHARLGDQAAASPWFEKATRWLDENQSALEKNPRYAQELRRFHAEAAELLHREQK